MALQDRPRRHGRQVFFIEGEGLVGQPADEGDGVSARSGITALSGVALRAAPTFRFGRTGPQGKKLPDPILRKVGEAMTRGADRDDNIPAGFTYLGQFVDHDLTFDKTMVAFGDQISPADLVQGRSPTLDLDSLYGAGPLDPVSSMFYEADLTRLKVGKTTRIGSDIAPRRLRRATRRDGLPAEKRKAKIPDLRNDENLAVAQHHAAMIRFHNRVVGALGVGVPPADRFRPGPAPRRAPLPVDAEDRLPAAHLRRRGRHRRLHQRTQGRASRVPTRSRCRRCRSSSRSEPSGSATPWCGSPTPGTPVPERFRRARPAVPLLRHERRPRRQPDPAEQLDRRLATALPLRPDRPARPQAAAGRVQPRAPARHRVWSTRCRCCRSARSVVCPPMRSRSGPTSPSAISCVPAWSGSPADSRWPPCSAAAECRSRRSPRLSCATGQVVPTCRT